MAALTEAGEHAKTMPGRQPRVDETGGVRRLERALSLRLDGGHLDRLELQIGHAALRQDLVHSNEQASIQVSSIKSGQVVFAYSANKQSSAHGKKSTAEACAKHLKEKIESGK